MYRHSKTPVIARDFDFLLYCYSLIKLKPRLTKGGCQGHIGNLFYILCGHFHEKIGCNTLPGGRVSRKSEGKGSCCNLFSFQKTLIRHFEIYLHTMMMKLTEHVGIKIFLLYKQNTR